MKITIIEKETAQDHMKVGVLMTPSEFLQLAYDVTYGCLLAFGLPPELAKQVTQQTVCDAGAGILNDIASKIEHPFLRTAYPALNKMVLLTRETPEAPTPPGPQVSPSFPA